MRVTERVKVSYNKYWDVVEFNNLNEYIKYIEETPTNKTFDDGDYLSSKRVERGNYNWRGTKTYKEAKELMKSGWTVGAEKLTQKLKIAEANKQVDTVYKNILSMAGYQAIVPLYLQGVPNCMVNKKPVKIKNKVITINRVMVASASVSSETLMDESIKCFQIIKKIESAGYRVNLNLIMSNGYGCIKVRLKSASEKLNISKLAFPLIHPAMFRRMFFRFIEVYPTMPTNYRYTYGSVPSESEFKAMCPKGEIILPTLLKGHTEDEIVRLSIDELIGRFGN